MKLIPWILIVLLSIMLMLSWCSRPADNSGKLAPDTLWTLVVDTIRDTIIPPPEVEHYVRVDTVLLPVMEDPDVDIDSTLPDSMPVMEDPDVDIDSTLPDSMPVIIPIMEREYRTDDYRILINGYNPELKSVELYRPTMLGTIKQRNKRWGIGLSAGYGIGSGGFSPVLAVTINYNLLQW